MVLSRRELGEKVRQARLKKSIKTGEKYTQEMMAKDLDVSRSYLGDIERGTKYPNYVLLSKISEVCDLPLSYFDEDIENQIATAVNRELREPNDIPGQTYFASMNMETSMSVVHDREYGYLDKGFIPIPVYISITKAFENDNLYSYEAISIDMAGGNNYFGLVSQDDSMDNSRILKKDIVIAKIQSEANNGDIAIVSVDNQEAIIRRYYKTGDMVSLVPETSNKEFQPVFIDTSKVGFKIHGKVVKFIGKV